jgi:SAM-dependent methyltransferase
MDEERPYVLGTHDEEVQRLGLQHRAWRRQVLEAWRRAGISEGHTVLDVGCGPGHATLDLAEIVGPTGHVVALDRSRRFLDVLQGSARARGLGNVAIHPVDFDLGDLPDVRAGAAWCRWILAFVARPRELLERVCAALEPGGAIVIHEYFDYGTWRIGPQCPELSEFVAAVMRSWRDAGGEPDVGLQVPQWLREIGFVPTARPIVEIVAPGDRLWSWLRAFIEGGRRRLVELRYLTPSHADAIWRAFTAAESAGMRMVTPGVVEIVASRASSWG